MLDILNRELNIGDIIVYGDVGRSNYQTFSVSKFGIIKKFIEAGKRNVKVPNYGNSIPSANGFNFSNTILKPTSYTIVEMPILEKIVFYPIQKEGSHYLLRKQANNKTTPQFYLTTKCLKINKEDLTDEWKVIYDKVCKELNIC